MLDSVDSVNVASTIEAAAAVSDAIGGSST
jgi:hypothetical protein